MEKQNIDLDLGEEIKENNKENQHNNNQKTGKLDLEINTRKQTEISYKDKIKKWKLLTGIFAGVSVLGVVGSMAGPLIVNTMMKNRTSSKWNVSIFADENLSVATIKEIDKNTDLIINIKTKNTFKPSNKWSKILVTGGNVVTLESIGAIIDISSVEKDNINWSVTIPANVITNNVSINFSSTKISNLKCDYKSSETIFEDSPFLLAGEKYSYTRLQNGVFVYDDKEEQTIPNEELKNLVITDNETGEVLKESDPFEVMGTVGIVETKYSIKYKNGTGYNFNKIVVDDKQELKLKTTTSVGFTIDPTKKFIGIKLNVENGEEILSNRTLVLTLSGGTAQYISELNKMYAYYKTESGWQNIEIIGSSDGENTKLVFNNETGIVGVKEFYIWYNNQNTTNKNDNVSIEINFEDITKLYIKEGEISSVRNIDRTVDLTFSLNPVLQIENIVYKNNTVKFYKEETLTEEAEIENVYYSNTQIKIPKNKISEFNVLYFAPEVQFLNTANFVWDIKENNTAKVELNSKFQNKSECTGVSLLDKFGNMDVETFNIKTNDGQKWDKIETIALPKSCKEYTNIKDLPILKSLILENGAFDEQATSATDAINSTSLLSFKIKEIDSTETAKWQNLLIGWTQTTEGEYIIFTKP